MPTQTKDGKKTGKVGKGNPPVEHQFSSTNQPPAENKVRGKSFKRIYEQMYDEMDWTAFKSNVSLADRQEIERLFGKQGVKAAAYIIAKKGIFDEDLRALKLMQDGLDGSRVILETEEGIRELDDEELQARFDGVLGRSRRVAATNKKATAKAKPKKPDNKKAPGKDGGAGTPNRPGNKKVSKK